MFDLKNSRRDIGNKKGQITIFMIIGIIAVIAIGMGMYLESKGVIDIGREARPFVEEVPVQARPISTFVQNCLEQVAIDGLRKIGDHGGYIDWRSIPGLKMNPASPTDSNAIAFFQGSEMVLPYWWYMDSSNTCEKTGDCKFDSKRPPLYRGEGANSIEVQLDEYVDEHLVECLRGFETFQIQKFEVTELSSPKTKTSVTDQAVVFELEYPLEITKERVKYRTMKYFVEVPLNLKEIYELGVNITRLQAELTIFEQYTQHLISLYGSLDKHAMPPIAGFELSYSGGTKWKKQETMEKMKMVLTTTIPLLQVVGTNNFMVPDIPLDEEWAITQRSLYVIHSMFNIGEEEHRSLDVTFDYFPHWELYFDLNCKGEDCKAQSASVGLFEQAFGIKRYNFVYDVSYPVFVDITNPSAFKEQGYSFKFFIEANMRNNVPITAAAPPAPPRRSSEPLLCGELYTNTPAKIIVLDAKEDSLLDGAEVSFKCGLDTCALGTTVHGVTEGKIPECINGMIYVSKKGYLSRWSPADVLDAEPIERTIRLEPYREIDFVGKRYLFRKVPGVGWRFFPQPDYMKGAESMVIILQRKTGVGDVPFMSTAEVSGGRDSGENSKGIRIVPGTYDVMITILDRSKIYIPGDSPMEFNYSNPYMAGGVHIATWTLTEDMLANAEAIQFNGYDYDLASVLPETSRTIEDVSYPADFDGNTQQYLSYLTPKIVYRS